MTSSSFVSSGSESVAFPSADELGHLQQASEGAVSAKKMNLDLVAAVFLIGVAIGIVLTVAYSLFIRLVFGSGHISGHSDDKFGSFWVGTSHGQVRVLKLSHNPNKPKQSLVVLIHGFAGTSDMWADPVRSNYCQILAQGGHPVITFDLYGHGGSSSPDTLYSSELFASQLAELCILFHVQEPFVLLAHSMGSSVAVTFAHRYPNLVSRVLLISPSIVDMPVDWLLWFALSIPILRELLSLVIIPTFGQGENKNNSGLVRACFRLLETRMKYRGSWNAGNLKSLQMLDSLSRTSLAGTNSILMLWGREDAVVRLVEVKRLLNIAPHAKFCVIEDADHMSFADGPDHIRQVFLSHILDFLGNTEDSQAMPTLSEYLSNLDQPQTGNGYFIM